MGKFNYIIFVILISFVLQNKGFSQSLHTNSNRALRAYNEGLKWYDYLEMGKAESLFKEAVSEDSRFFEAYMMLGELYTKQKKFADASVNYQKAVNIDSTTYRRLYFSLANAEMMTGNYTAALQHYKLYLKNTGNTDKNITLAERNIINCEFAVEAMKKPVEFQPVNAGPSVNTDDDEYWPSITADGQTLMFTRQVFSDFYPAAMTSSQEDVYLSYLGDDGWKKAFNAGAPLNSKQNEGAQTLSSNGNYMFFTACSRPGGLGSCDIYFSAFKDGNWSMPYNVGPPINSASWESTPSISADGNMLIFSSNRPGGSGGRDLWYSLLNDKGAWRPPVNLGTVINTKGDEMSPFIHFDGRTLYYASDGKPGMGGFDIFMSRMNVDSTWSEPKNIGYPINTYNDEMGLVIESGGSKAYFSTIREIKNGKDIYYFNLQESIRPDPVSYLKGKVSDRETGKLLKADYELINLSTNRVTMKNTTDDAGNFLVCLPSGYNYGINVSKSGYLFHSENFMLEGEHTAMEPYIKRINLSPLRVGEKMLLTNVFYEVDSWKLKNESVEELNNLSDLLAANNNLIVEIGGYTDSTGSVDYNLQLSEKRANSVVNFLVSKGISSERLSSKGYGNTSPIGDNITTEGRQLNRRTEAKIIAVK